MGSLFTSVLNMSMISSYVIVGIILVRLILKKAPKIFSYSLWAVVLVKLLIPFSFETSIGLLPNNAQPSSKPISTQTIYDKSPQINTNFKIEDNKINNGVELKPTPYVETTHNSKQILIIISALIWIVGIIGISIYNILGVIKLRRRLKEAKCIKDNIYVSNNIDSPFVMGVIKPRIYLISGLSNLEQEFIIKHERCHIKRLDHITRILAFIALTIHWFNPLVWIAFILSDKDMELSCDEAVMRDVDADIRVEYSKSLLTLATGKRSALNTKLAFGEGDTKDRVKNVMNYKKPMLIVCALLAIVVVIITVAFMSSRETKNVSLNVDKSTDSNLDSEVGSGTNNNVEEDNILYETDEVLLGILADWKYRDQMVQRVGINSEVLNKIQDIVNKQVEENNRIREEGKKADIDKGILENNKRANDELKSLLGEKYELLSQYANRWWTLKHYDYTLPKDMEAFLKTITYPQSFSYRGYKYENNELILELNQTKEETWSRVLEELALEIYYYIPNLQSIEFVTSLPSDTVRKNYDRQWYNYQMGYDEEINKTDNKYENYDMIYDYIWKEIYHTFSPLYDVDRIEVSDYEERDGASYLDVTMYYYNYNRDPDTVGYIAKLKEAGDKNYQQLYDEYLEEQYGSFYFKAIVDGDGTVTLYSDDDPSDKEQWIETKLSEYVIKPEQINKDDVQETRIAGYIVFNEGNLLIDEIEIITSEDTEKMEALGLTEDADLPEGYNFYNLSSEVVKLPLSESITYDFIDSGQVYEKEAEDRHYTTKVLEEFYTASAYRKELTLEEQKIPYLIDIRDGEVYKITEVFLYTQ